jgi:hypothetical protein
MISKAVDLKFKSILSSCIKNRDVPMNFPSWSDLTVKVGKFEEAVSKFENKVDNKINDRIKDDSDRHPLIAKAFKASLHILPPPVDGIAESIYESFDGSDETKWKSVKKYFDDIKIHGEDHYNIIVTHLNNIKTLTAKESTLELIKNILISNDDTIKEKLELLRKETNNIMELHKKLEGELYKQYGLSWLPRDYFEDHISTAEDIKSWKNGFPFKLPSVMQKKEFR